MMPLFCETPCALQSTINYLQIYYKSWDLKVNTKKTKIMIFEKGKKENVL